MPNNVDSIIANEALQQTSAPPCSPRLFVIFSAPWLLTTTKRLVIKGKKNDICTYRLPDLGYDTTNTSSAFVWKLKRNCSSFAGLPVLRVAIFNPLIL